MDNLKFLKLVAINDVNCLLEKEKTYKGSWKKSGGKSSWSMIQRKIDRLTVLMAHPVEPNNLDLDGLMDRLNYDGLLPEDIDAVEFLVKSHSAGDVFYKITEEETLSGGVGEDGSVLAEIRDLRRYTMLLESELVARGVVVLPDYDEPDDEALHALIDDEDGREHIL